jgi:hypothetical protein
VARTIREASSERAASVGGAALVRLGWMAADPVAMIVCGFPGDSDFPLQTGKKSGGGGRGDGVRAAIAARWLR